MARRFGQLTAYLVVGTVRHGRNNVNIWECQCDCGRIINVDQNSLFKLAVPACKVCRRGPCVVCGSDITNEEYSLKRNTCSDECWRENRRIKQRASYKIRASKDPDFHKKHYQAALARDPDHNKKRYQKKLEKLKAMSEEDRRAFLDKEYKICNEWTKAKRAFLRENDPVGYEAFLKKCR